MIGFKCREIELVFSINFRGKGGVMGLLKGHVLLAWNLIREELTEMFHFISKRFVMKIDLFPISVFVSDDNFNSDGKRQLYLFLFIRGK